MSTVSELHNPLLGSAVPDDIGYSAPRRKHKGKVKRQPKLGIRHGWDRC